MIDPADSRCGRPTRARSAAKCWKSWATAATTWAPAVSKPEIFCARDKNDEANLHGIQPGLVASGPKRPTAGACQVLARSLATSGSDKRRGAAVSARQDSTAALASALMLRSRTVRRQGRVLGEPALGWLWRMRRHLRFLGRTRILATGPCPRQSWLRSRSPTGDKRPCGKPTFVGIGGRPSTGLAGAPPNRSTRCRDGLHKVV